MGLQDKAIDPYYDNYGNYGIQFMISCGQSTQLLYLIKQSNSVEILYSK